jgi:hypothetical protein
MSIVFDQVEGVVEKREGGPTTPPPTAGAKPAAPAAESHAHHQRILEDRARRLHAD